MAVKNSETHSRTTPEPTKQWASYAKAAGLGAFALGAASSGDAAVIHNGGTYNGAAPTFPLVINPVSYTGANRFNIDGAGLDDFALGTGGYSTVFARDLGLEPGNPLGGMVLTSGEANAYYTFAFAANAAIDGAAPQSKNNYGARTLGLASFAPGFLGFKTSEGNFGWMKLSVASRDGDGLKIITIDEWAIEDSGAAILAGSLTSIPEPNSLALLAAGSIGLLARRRRQQITS